jgi:hypothetical protein
MLCDCIKTPKSTYITGYRKKERKKEKLYLYLLHLHFAKCLNYTFSVIHDGFKKFQDKNISDLAELISP